MRRLLLLFIILNVVLVDFIGDSVVPGAQSLLVGSHQPIRALVGQDVLLPCYLKPAVSADDETVEWTRSDLEPKYVHFHKDGRLWFEKQDESYLLRTRLFMDELPRGNVSMQIFKVKESDAGTYKCSLPSMKTEAHIQLIVGVSSGLRLHCPDEAVEAVAGQNVTLRCSTDPPMKPDRVDWMVNNNNCDVYFFLDGKVDLNHQCEEYRGKASLFLDELSSGNSSLRLMTQMSHSGRYRCSVRVRDWKDYCSINLTVHQRGDPLQDNTLENPTAVDSPRNSTFTDKVGIGVGITIVLLIIGVIWFLRKKCNRRQGQDNTIQKYEPAQEPMNQSGNRNEIETRIM